MKSIELLTAAVNALNLIPNTRLYGQPFKDTYALASAIDKQLKAPEPNRAVFTKIDPEPFDDLEVQAIWTDGENCEPAIKKEDASFFSVYVHNTAGGVQCFADCPTEEQAVLIHDTVKTIAENWEKDDNGYTQGLEAAVKEMLKAFKHHGSRDLNDIPVSTTIDMLNKALKRKPKK